MGISGLLSFVKDATEQIHIKKYAGQVVAVDTYCWIHRGSFACADKLAKKERTDQYVKYCMKYLDMLEKFHVKPVLVFDGCRLPSKELVEQERHKRRRQNLEKGKQLLREGNASAARDCFTKCVSVTPAMALEVIEASRARGIDCVVAPYEADSQLAFFSKSGLAQAIITEDSDLLCFGCKNVVFKMDLTGRAQEVKLENLGAVKNLVGFTPDSFRQMCILSGCDYLHNVKGVGLVKACKALKLSKTKDGYQVAKKLHQYIKGIAPVSPSYGTDFIRADQTFLYQLVFNPQTKKLQPLNDYPADINLKDFEFAGPYIPDDKAFQIALGNIDINTQQVIGHFDLNKWLLNRKPVDNLPSIWGDKPALNFTKDSAVFCEKSKEGVKSPPLLPNLNHFPRESSNMLCANDVLNAVVSNNASSDNDKIHPEPLKEKQSKSNILIHMSELLKSYNGSQKTTKDDETEKVSKVVKSRFFASKSTADCSIESIHCIPESELSSAEQSSLSTEQNESNDSVLDNILEEMTVQTKRRTSRVLLKRKNPFLEKRGSVKSQKLINSSGENLEKFLHRRKKKKLLIPNALLNNKSESCPKLAGNLSDEAIPLLDAHLNSESLLKYSASCSPPQTLDLSSNEPASNMKPNKSLSGEDIPFLDRSPSIDSSLFERPPLSPIVSENTVKYSDQPDALKNIKKTGVICLSSEDEDVENTLSVEPQKKRRLGLPMQGHFKGPVKLNLSKYFSGSKASGLRKAKKKSCSGVSENQPSITSFFKS